MKEVRRFCNIDAQGGYFVFAVDLGKEKCSYVVQASTDEENWIDISFSGYSKQCKNHLMNNWDWRKRGKGEVEIIIGNTWQHRHFRVMKTEIKKRKNKMSCKNCKACNCDRSMGFREYQSEAVKTAAYPKENNLGIYYTAMGLGGEAGEILNKVKKLLRGDDTNREALQTDLCKELGDVLWYVAAMCSELGLSLQGVAELNNKKLQSRMKRGKIKGKGDSR